VPLLNTNIYALVTSNPIIIRVCWLSWNSCSSSYWDGVKNSEFPQDYGVRKGCKRSSIWSVQKLKGELLRPYRSECVQPTLRSRSQIRVKRWAAIGRPNLSVPILLVGFEVFSFGYFDLNTTPSLKVFIEFAMPMVKKLSVFRSRWVRTSGLRLGFRTLFDSAILHLPI
jgi:hypothetical protein